MRFMAAFGAAVLILLLGTTVPAYSERNDGDKRDGHEKQAEREKPGKGHVQPGKPHPEGKHAAQRHRPESPDHPQQGTRHERPRHDVRVVHPVQHNPGHIEPRYEHRVVWQERRAREWAHEHRSWRERGGYHGYRVPHDRYIVYFGPEHRFRIHTLPVVIVAGHPRFRYQGYWVSVVDPWPEHWATNWYETDEVYVHYVDDGYYLYNVRHPGVGIAVNISF